jgi:hypothetical protein
VFSFFSPKWVKVSPKVTESIAEGCLKSAVPIVFKVLAWIDSLLPLGLVSHVLMLYGFQWVCVQS